MTVAKVVLFSLFLSFSIFFTGCEGYDRKTVYKIGLPSTITTIKVDDKEITTDKFDYQSLFINFTLLSVVLGLVYFLLKSGVDSKDFTVLAKTFVAHSVFTNIVNLLTLMLDLEIIRFYPLEIIVLMSHMLYVDLIPATLFHLIGEDSYDSGTYFKIGFVLMGVLVSIFMSFALKFPKKNPS